MMKVIVLKKNTETPRLKYRSKPLPRKYLRKLELYIHGILRVDPRKYLLGEPRLTCIGETCIIHEGRNEYPATTIYSGRWIGLVINDKPYLSPVIYEEIYRDNGFRAAVIAKEKGVKAFLYGNDLLPISVEKIYEPRREAVAVIDKTDYRVIGVARWDPRMRVFKNIYDLGLFLRNLG